LNAILALEVLHEFKVAQSGLSHSEAEKKTVRNQMLQQLHHVDFSPHELVLRWVTAYIRAWLEYYLLRWMKVKKVRDEAEKKKDREMLRGEGKG
jgi:hypothetical protein